MILSRWYLGAILCDLWTLSDVLLCTASILNLCAISIDRYFIILHAMKYTQNIGRDAEMLTMLMDRASAQGYLLTDDIIDAFPRAEEAKEHLEEMSAAMEGPAAAHAHVA